MTMTVTGRELGVADCDFEASGETAGDVVREMVDHLRSEHDIDMPDADVILAGKVSEEPLAVDEPGPALVVERLISKLDIMPPEDSGPEIVKPIIPRLTNAT